MHGVSRLTNIRILALSNNGILQIEGLKDLIYLKVLKLAGKYNICCIDSTRILFLKLRFKVSFGIILQTIIPTQFLQEA